VTEQCARDDQPFGGRATDRQLEHTAAAADVGLGVRIAFEQLIVGLALERDAADAERDAKVKAVVPLSAHGHGVGGRRRVRRRGRELRRRRQVRMRRWGWRGLGGLVAVCGRRRRGLGVLRGSA
jgi:hypothetical protein